MKYIITESQFKNSISDFIERFIKLQNIKIIITSNVSNTAQKQRIFGLRFDDYLSGDTTKILLLMEIDNGKTIVKDHLNSITRNGKFGALGMDKEVKEYFLNMLEHFAFKFPKENWLEFGTYKINENGEWEKSYINYNY